MPEVSEKEFPDELWDEIKHFLLEWKKTHKRKFKDVTGLLKFHKELKEIFSHGTFWDLTGSFRFYLGNFEYKFDLRTQKFLAEDIVHAPEESIPFHKFYIFDNIGEILLKYLSGEDEHLLRKLLIYYPNILNKMLYEDVSSLRKLLVSHPHIGETQPELWKYTYNFGKKKKRKKKRKKKKKKLSSDIKKKCKKKGIRLTYTRKGKRIYKSEKVLRKQLSNRT